MSKMKRGPKPTPQATKWYGWKPDLPDQRDLVFSAVRKAKALPPKFDIKAKLPMLFNQLQLGSCTANATANQVWAVDQTNPFQPSRLFIYYMSRYLEGTTGYDAGATIRDSIKSVVRYGFPPEKSWPYVISRFKQKPTTTVMKQAAGELALEYGRINQTLNDLKSVIAAGYFVNFGFSVYESFESQAVERTGVVPLPKSNEQLLGGHAILLAGWDDSTKRFLCPNWWWTDWGMGGWLTIGYDYILNPNLASDFWQVRKVV